MKVSRSVKARYLIGIDEAGRGPLAGPVAIGVFAVKSPGVLRSFRGVKDSKQLSERQREEWFSRIRLSVKNGEAAYTVAYARPETIDARGLTYSIYSALNRALMRLEGKGCACVDAKILLDGSLYASSRYVDQTTIIDGDAREPIIALASICAKVSRDRRMKKLARDYPQYGFDIHKGYGTKAHYKALRKYGLCPHHRKSFLTRIV